MMYVLSVLVVKKIGQIILQKVMHFKESIMPVKKVKGGYKWGSTGKVYKTKEAALKQARAAYASGYKKKKKK